MNTDNYNTAIERLALYRHVAVLAGRGTPDCTAYIGKLTAGSSILAIASGKDFGVVSRDVCEAYAPKYSR